MYGCWYMLSTIGIWFSAWGAVQLGALGRFFSKNSPMLRADTGLTESGSFDELIEETEKKFTLAAQICFTTAYIFVWILAACVLSMLIARYVHICCKKRALWRDDHEGYRDKRDERILREELAKVKRKKMEEIKKKKEEQRKKKAEEIKKKEAENKIKAEERKKIAEEKKKIMEERKKQMLEKKKRDELNREIKKKKEELKKILLMQKKQQQEQLKREKKLKQKEDLFGEKLE